MKEQKDKNLDEVCAIICMERWSQWKVIIRGSQALKTLAPGLARIWKLFLKNIYN